MHGRPRPGGRARAVVLVGGLVASIGACGGVEVAAAPQADSPACADVAAAWPSEVGGHARTSTRPELPSVAAWGDPAVVARCGVPAPGPTTQECIAVDEVDWIVHDLADGMRFTTFGRQPALEVIVPDDYAPEPLLLGAFTQAAGSLPRTSLRCS